MKHIYLIAIALVIIGTTTFAQSRKGVSREDLNPGGGTVIKILDHRMNPVELKAFLQERTSGQMMGSFASYTSLLWAVYEVGVWSEGTDADNVQLKSSFAENYSPTWNELMDALARQVSCTWHYNHDTGYWVFENKTMEWPFVLKIAKGWTRRNDGQSVVFVPPIAPVGMDVYVMGHYSAEESAKLPEIFENARKHASKIFARRFKSDVADKDFTDETICGVTALHFSAPAPRDPKLTWRQWAFVKNGWCFVIVSVISRENEPQLLPDVKAMIASFELLDKR
jgi:hypothetical protein